MLAEFEELTAFDEDGHDNHDHEEHPHDHEHEHNNHNHEHDDKNEEHDHDHDALSATLEPQEEIGTFYRISGMNCNHCKANVERAIRNVEGVEDVTVDLASGTAFVKGNHDTEVLIKQVQSYGYGAEIKD